MSPGTSSGYNVTEAAFENALLTKCKAPTTLLGWGLKESDALGHPLVCGLDAGWDPCTELCCSVASCFSSWLLLYTHCLFPKPAVSPWECPDWRAFSCFAFPEWTPFIRKCWDKGLFKPYHQEEDKCHKSHLLFGWDHRLRRDNTAVLESPSG